ncbi:hypothetical protein L7F22_050895 [Adiantum nelumboides]|nr:hypothetical protein [Adiantum nelumboides]
MASFSYEHLHFRDRDTLIKALESTRNPRIKSMRERNSSVTRRVFAPELEKSMMGDNGKLGFSMRKQGLFAVREVNFWEAVCQRPQSARIMSRNLSCTIYVGNLPGDVREEEVEDLFRKYGRIVDIDLKLPPRSPAFCFLQFEEARDAEDAVKGRDGVKYAGSTIRVELAHGGRSFLPSADRHGNNSGRSGIPRRAEFRVYVSKLPWRASWQDLKDHMRQAGDVSYAQVFHEAGGKAPFEVIEGRPKSPLLLKVHGKIFAADEYSRDLKESFQKIKEAISISQQKQKAAANKHRRALAFKESDWVLLKFPPKARLRHTSGKNPTRHQKYYAKLAKRYHGPFQILKPINEMAYQLKLPNHWLIHNAFHVSLLKPYKGEPPSEAITEDPPEVEDQEEVLQPESILRHEDEKVEEQRQQFPKHFIKRNEGVRTVTLNGQAEGNGPTREPNDTAQNEEQKQKKASNSSSTTTGEELLIEDRIYDSSNEDVESNSTAETKTDKEAEAMAKRKSGLPNWLLPDDQEIEEWNLGSEKDPKMIKINKQLKKELKDKAYNLFLKFKYVFTWEYTDLKELDPEVWQHRISLKPNAKPVHLQRYKMNPNYAKKVKEEIDIDSLKNLEIAKHCKAMLMLNTFFWFTC